MRKTVRSPKTRALGFVGDVESEPEYQAKAISWAQKVKWMQGDKGIRKPKQEKSTKEEVTNLLRSKRPFSPFQLSGSRWWLFLLKGVNQADDHDLAWLEVLLGIVELGIVEDASQITAMERTFRVVGVDYGGIQLTVN